MVWLSRPYTFKLFKGCLPQILPGPLLNTWTHIEYPLSILYLSGILLDSKLNFESNIGSLSRKEGQEINTRLKNYLHQIKETYYLILS